MNLIKKYKAHKAAQAQAVDQFMANFDAEAAKVRTLCSSSQEYQYLLGLLSGELDIFLDGHKFRQLSEPALYWLHFMKDARYYFTQGYDLSQAQELLDSASSVTTGTIQSRQKRAFRHIEADFAAGIMK